MACTASVQTKKKGFSGHIYGYIKSLLTGRSIVARVDNTYSSPQCIDMGIQQGSIIAPILFNIMVYDITRSITKKGQVVQYADDIALWMNCSMRNNTPPHRLV